MCEDCHAQPKFHKQWCPRLQRSMTAVARRLRSEEQAAKLPEGEA